MCGLFGFITSHGAGPEVHRLQQLALATQTRGTHAFGLAWLEADGAIQTWKQPAAAGRCLDQLDRCREALVVIGHCRYATHGSPLDHRNNHPHVAGRGYIMHNGVVWNHAELARRYGLRPRGQCDSEILGLLLARGSGTITRRAAWTTERAIGDLALLGVWRRPSRLLVVRRGNPLHVGQGPEGHYFASLPEGLPGPVRAMADHTAFVLAYDQGGLRLEGRPVGLR